MLGATAGITEASEKPRQRTRVTTTSAFTFVHNDTRRRAVQASGTICKELSKRQETLPAISLDSMLRTCAALGIPWGCMRKARIVGSGMSKGAQQR
eukprot:282836-Amphidinium_carterae.1